MSKSLCWFGEAYLKHAARPLLDRASVFLSDEFDELCCYKDKELYNLSHASLVLKYLVN